MRWALAVQIGVVLGMISTAANAKDMSHRLGVGYQNNSSLAIPSLAMKYHMNGEVALGANLGLDTTSGASRFATAARLYRTIFTEDNLNFYGGASAGAVSHEQTGSNNVSGFEISAFLGAEFFLPGLENLGISFEAGIGVTSDSAGTRFRTIADTPLQAGMIFYF